MCSSVHIDNKKKDISILGKCPTQGLDDTTLTSMLNVKLGIVMGTTVFFVNATKIDELKAKDYEIKRISLVFSKYFRRFFS